MTKIQIDVDGLNSFIKQETHKAKQEAKRDADEFASDTGSTPQAFLGVDSLDDIDETFCDLWPSVKKLLRYAGWIPGIGALLAKVKIVVAAIDKYVVPALCQKAGGESETATVKTEVKKNFT